MRSFRYGGCWKSTNSSFLVRIVVEISNSTISFYFLPKLADI